jgi:hypothetical protein
MSIFIPIEVHPIKVEYTDNIWRALYIELEEKQILTKWHKDICDLLSINYSKDFLPHISLMYNTVSLKEKERISSKIQLQSVYKICSIQIVDCNEKVDDWIPVFEQQI